MHPSFFLQIDSSFRTHKNVYNIHVPFFWPTLNHERNQLFFNWEKGQITKSIIWHVCSQSFYPLKRRKWPLAAATGDAKSDKNTQQLFNLGRKQFSRKFFSVCWKLVDMLSNENSFISSMSWNLSCKDELVWSIGLSKSLCRSHLVVLRVTRKLIGRSLEHLVSVSLMISLKMSSDFRSSML